jgi:hypothetical protein
MLALLSKKLVEESKWYQYLKAEVKQSNANGILPNSLNIAKLVLVLLAALHIQFFKSHRSLKLYPLRHYRLCYCARSLGNNLAMSFWS